MVILMYPNHLAAALIACRTLRSDSAYISTFYPTLRVDRAALTMSLFTGNAYRAGWFTVPIKRVVDLPDDFDPPSFSLTIENFDAMIHDLRADDGGLIEFDLPEGGDGAYEPRRAEIRTSTAVFTFPLGDGRAPESIDELLQRPEHHATPTVNASYLAEATAVIAEFAGQTRVEVCPGEEATDPLRLYAGGGDHKERKVEIAIATIRVE